MKKASLFLISLFLYLASFSQELRFQVHSGDHDYLDCPVSMEIQTGFFSHPEKLVLYEVMDGTEKPVPSQLESGPRLLFSFIVEGNFDRGSSRMYILREEEGPVPERFELNIQHGYLEILQAGSHILRYQTEEMLPPEGVTPLYKRSAFIHPLWSPGGEILTNIQPPDHYHHYGIWSPWTKTHVRGREVDYWNLAKGQGTVRFKSLLSTTNGNLYAGFSSLHEHVDFGAEGPDRVNMLETWNIRAWRLSRQRNARMIDYESLIYNNIDDTILFDAYRYGGGLGYRATANWKKGSCTVLTSEGLSRNEADGERARWCIIEGESLVRQGRSGILFLSHPHNYDHPEALRVWPDDAAGGLGELMFDYCPVRLKEWVILPRKTYALQYRMVVFDGEISPEVAERYWNGYAFPPEIRIINE